MSDSDNDDALPHAHPSSVSSGSSGDRRRAAASNDDHPIDDDTASFFIVGADGDGVVSDRVLGEGDDGRGIGAIGDEHRHGDQIGEGRRRDEAPPGDDGVYAGRPRETADDSGRVRGRDQGAAPSPPTHYPNRARDAAQPAPTRGRPDSGGTWQGQSQDHGRGHQVRVGVGHGHNHQGVRTPVVEHGGRGHHHHHPSPQTFSFAASDDETYLGALGDLRMHEMGMGAVRDGDVVGDGDGFGYGRDGTRTYLGHEDTLTPEVVLAQAKDVLVVGDAPPSSGMPPPSSGMPPLSSGMPPTPGMPPSIDGVVAACKASREDLDMVMTSIRSVAPTVYQVLIQAVAEEDRFWAEVQQGCTSALKAMHHVLAQYGQRVQFAQEALRKASHGARVRAQARLKTLGAAAAKDRAALQQSAADLVAEWHGAAAPYRAAQEEALATIMRTRAAMPAGSTEQAACDSAVGTVRVLRDILATTGAELEAIAATSGQDFLAESAHALGLVHSVMEATSKQVREVVAAIQRAPGKGGLASRDVAAVEREVRDAEAGLAAAKARLARTASVSVSTPTPTPTRTPARTPTTMQSIETERQRRFAEADVVAASDKLRVLLEDLSTARVHQVMRQMDAASQAQSKWLHTAHRLKHATKKLIATSASKHEKALMCEAVTLWAADRTVADAQCAAYARLTRDGEKALAALGAILHDVTLGVQSRVHQEAADRPTKLGLEKLGTLMLGAGAAATTVAALAMQYRDRLQVVCQAYAAAAAAALQFVYGWLAHHIHDVPRLQPSLPAPIPG